MKPIPKTESRNKALDAVPPAHLRNAASSLQGILSRRSGQYTYIVAVGEGDRDDPASEMPALTRKTDVSAVGKDPDPILNRNAPPATNGADNHSR